MDPENEYHFNHQERGVAIIVNIMQFDNRQIEPRPHAAVDSVTLEETFKMLGCEVRSFVDLRRAEIINELINVATEDHSGRDCFIFAISTHGDEQFKSEELRQLRLDVLAARDMEINLRDITEIFTEKNCPSLKGKPKLFFIQSCRGTKVAKNVEIEMEDEEMEDEDSVDFGWPRTQVVQNIPIMRDCLLAWSAPPGFFSFKRKSHGSWFFTAMRRVFKERHHNTDLLTMLVEVNHSVAREFESNSPRSGNLHQRHIIPWIASMLTKDLYFRPKTP